MESTRCIAVTINIGVVQRVEKQLVVLMTIMFTSFS